MSISINVSGNVGQNPTYKSINRSDGSVGEVCNFSVGSNDYKRISDEAGNVSYEQVGETTWVECEFWGKQAQHLAKVIQKGMPVIVSGNEYYSTYEKDGQKVIARHLRVENVSLNLMSSRIEQITLKPAKQADSAENTDTPL
ncbi:MAG: single-stranded DNA-binding protein [Neisseriaceae bacterium]|nr:single-stranded DNA-binding protein [Neisseriaceae bacterium]